MKNTQTHTVSLIATARVSIREWNDKVSVTFEELPGTSVVVEGVATEEFLRSCVYFIHGLSTRKDLSNPKQMLLNTILKDLKVMETNQTKVEA